jgi:hypothetical protein
MTDFFKHDERITDPALIALEKKVHWLMYQIYQSNLANQLENTGIDSSFINYNNFPANFDPKNLQADATEVGNNSDA